MTNQRATGLSIPRGIVPGRLTVGTIQKSNDRGIKIYEMLLFASMAVVTGVTGGPPVFIHVLLVKYKVTTLNFPSNVNLVIMTVETQFLL